MNNDLIIYGCTDSLACNYNPNANINDSTCIPAIYGCTDTNAFNYDWNATCDDGSCTGEALEIAGVIDFSLGTTAGKAIHLRVLADIGDLSKIMHWISFLFYRFPLFFITPLLRKRDLKKRGETITNYKLLTLNKSFNNRSLDTWK